MNVHAPLAKCQPRFLPPTRPWAVGAVLAALTAALAGAGFAQEKASSPGVQVTIKDEKPMVVEQVLPVDPVRRINYQPLGLAIAIRGENNETLHLSHFPGVLVGGQFFDQGQGGRVDYQNQALLKKGAKDRDGYTSSYIYGDGVRVTGTFTVVPSKAQGKETKRQLNTILIHYVIENQSKQAQKVGFRIYMDTFIVDNDGCLFAAPTMPGKVLDGIVLKDKQLPPYVQLLQRPDLKNPMYVAHLTLDLGAKFEKPDRVVLTRHGNGFGQWEMPAMMAGGDSALGVFWDPKDIKPGGKRELVYAYGKGIAASPEGEGQFELALGGSFEVGKVFTITAYVGDLSPGQSLTLQLPDGMALVEGKLQQSVPDPGEGEFPSVVVWRARVLRHGEFPVRVRSSTGVTQGKIVTLSPTKG
jgi:hypothetical protein